MSKVDDYPEPRAIHTNTKVAATASQSNDIRALESKNLETLSPDLKDSQNGFITVEDDKGDSQPNQVMVLLGLLRKLIGVRDIISLRISLPASLLAPVGNLEYWNYMDRPDYFAAYAQIYYQSSNFILVFTYNIAFIYRISDPDSPLDRMVNVVRWWFSKDLKYVTGKLIKPYNSILGETFKCHWEVPRDLEQTQSYSQNESQKPISVKCMNEQISHHPPVSGFYYSCEEKGVVAKGIDHITARFSGTGPGDQNFGIFVQLVNRDNELYRLTHPWASINGWLKASLYATITECSYMTCPKTKIKAIVEYKEEKWIGKPKFEIQGAIFKYDPDNDNILKTKQVPRKDLLANIEGSWRTSVYIVYPDGQKQVLIDLTSLSVTEKIVKPIQEQEVTESRRTWQAVTESILAKDFNQATKHKQKIEEAQRVKAAERKAEGEEFVPQLFKLPVEHGQPELTDKGREVLSTL
ncbi:hypothetical protein NQZ79_g4562 [Umbelopsis isabellina]|nr:hypothetical protein NQZ79_g4562 [Umbelopsis isabellina]